MLRDLDAEETRRNLTLPKTEKPIERHQKQQDLTTSRRLRLQQSLLMKMQTDSWKIVIGCLPLHRKLNS